MWLARTLLKDAIMSFATLVNRVRADFYEMPGLELTLPQAVRLWNMGTDDCHHVLDALVDVGFLAWTAKRTIVRTGRDLHWTRTVTPIEDISVPVRKVQTNL